MRLIFVNFASHSQKRGRFSPQKFLPFLHKCFTSACTKYTKTQVFSDPYIYPYRRFYPYTRRYGFRENQYTVIFCAVLYYHNFHIFAFYTLQKMMFSIQNFFSKCEQTFRYSRICSHLLQKSLRKASLYAKSSKIDIYSVFFKFFLEYFVLLIIDLPAFFADGTF